MITFKELKVKLRTELWPFPGESKSLRPAHDSMFINGMIEMQRWVDCLKANNVSLYPWCSTYFNCGLTVINAPKGRINRLYTIVGEDWCTRQDYWSEDMQEINCWARQLVNSPVAPNVGLPKLPQGMRFVEKSLDSTVGRSHDGMFGLERSRIYVAPWIQSNETVVVEWDGLKKVWTDEDVIDEEVWGPDHFEAVKLFVAYKHEVSFGCDANKLEMARRAWSEALADHIYQCNEEMKRPENKGCCLKRLPTTAELNEEIVVPKTETIVFSHVGDMGDLTSSASKDVAALVDTFGPDFVLLGGDNYYGGAGTFAEFDETIGQFYQQYIFPYIGTYGPGATRNKLWPLIGNHDRDPSGNLDLYLDYFKLPNNEFFYDVVIGSVHIFMLDSGYDNSQVNQQTEFGITQSSKQAEWLRVKMAISTAKWKVVCLHHPPFCSTISSIVIPPLAGDGTLSYPALRWPFKDWGADIVINGHAHDYERLIIDELTYVTNGAGGRALLANFTTPNEDSVLRFNSDWGAMRFTVTCDTFKGEFITRGGILVDSFTFTKKTVPTSSFSLSGSVGGET